MVTLWSVLISLFVLGLAFLIKHFGLEVFEEDKEFKVIIAGYMIIYIAAAIGITMITPKFTAVATTSTNGTVTLDSVEQPPADNAFTAFLNTIKVK